MTKPMNKIEELIEELCPQGVEFRALGEVMTIMRGASPRPIRSFLTNDEEGINWLKIGDVNPSAKYVTKTAQKITQEGVKKSRFLNKGDFILSNSMSFGRPYILDINVCIHDGWISMSDFENTFSSDFLYHLLKSNVVQKYWKQKASSGTVQNLNADIVRNTKLPIPPLTIQEEIVKILDNFTQLEAELEAELEARKKQYEHYREELLSFGDDVEFRTLGEICEFMNGKGHEKKIDENGKYIVVNSKFVSTEGKVKKYSAEQISPIFENDILMVMSDLPNGKALAKCFHVDHNDKYTLNQRICALTAKDNDNLNAKYLFFILSRNRQLLRYDNGVDQTNLRKNDILKINIPIPPLSKQKEIVAILDKFDALANDISIGLPAEIAARKKQYEYYRNQLLSFKPLEAQDAN